MSPALKSTQAAIKAIRDLDIPGVSLSVMGASLEACVEIDYAEAEITAPEQLDPIYKAIDAALHPHGCSRGDASLVDGIEGIEIIIPGVLVKVECDGMTAIYECGFVSLDNRRNGVAHFAWGMIFGSADVDDIGARAQIVWEDDGKGDATDWDSPEAINVR